MRHIHKGDRGNALQCDESSKVAQYRGVEQLVARKSHKLEVVGSSPTLPQQSFVDWIFFNRLLFRARTKKF